MAGPSIAIIGAGIGGICLALDLKKKGINDFVIYEREDGVGGSWYKNGYPGCRSDIAAAWYSHSRFLNPNWSETHPPRDEIQAYWQDIVEKKGIIPHLRFGHNLQSAAWQSSSNDYSIFFTIDKSNEPFTVHHKILVSAIGGFSKPLWPNIKGMEKFEGKMFHASRWPSNVSVDTLRGKTIAVVGNGCSGSQIVSTLGSESDINVIAIARSPQWLVPSARPGPTSTLAYTSWQKSLFAYIPIILWLIRCQKFMANEFTWLLFPISGAWFRGPIQKKTGGWMRDEAPHELKPHIVPEYPLGAKRIIRDGGYLQALNYANVTPVWDNIAEVTEDSVITFKGQTFKVDYLALATGFDVTGGRLHIMGRDGQVTDTPERDPFYHGTTIPGYPNLFTLLGNNVAPSHASVLFQLEVQANYIAECLASMRRKKIDVIEVREQAAKEYNDWLDVKLETIVWTKAASFYRGGPDRNGRIFANWPGLVSQFWLQNRHPIWADYIGAEDLAKEQRRNSWMVGMTVAAVSVTAVVWLMA